ncbi:MAG: hypothetical protein FWF79_06620 [Defluviitaleaceae bacterium]|nr:hypothetical protein [Defluviitaleaceae bacterium]
MIVLYDLQDELQSVDAGDFSGACSVMPTGGNLPTLKVEETEDVKSLLVASRKSKQAGVGISLSSVPGVQPGDRITITGRFGSDTPSSSWGIALIVSEGSADGQHDVQKAHQIAPKDLFSLSHILEASETEKLFMLQTTSWGLATAHMDFYLDGILVSRVNAETIIEHDRRGTVYSLKEDPVIQRLGDNKSIQEFTSTLTLLKSGSPTLSIFKHGDTNAFHVGNRVRDWDAVDILLEKLGLMQGNKYEITVTGRIDGKIPEGTMIMFQGIPGYSWRSNKFAAEDKEFTLSHVLTQSEAANWTSLRITTNTIGAAVPFYIYSVDVKSLGVF